jgi:alkylated DNA nucleotide flippase Atl1
MARKKSWQEKLRESKGLPKVVMIKAETGGRFGLKEGETMAVPSPLEVDELMKKVPPGKVTTINEIRQAVAKKHKATVGCPLTTGIFAWIAAMAAEEARKEGLKNITCYWRTLKSGGFLNEKYPGGVEAQKILLEREGQKVVKKGQRYKVENLEQVLFKFE